MRGGNAQTASTGHQKASQARPDAVGELSFAAERRRRELNGDMAHKYHEIDTMEAAAPPRVRFMRYFACVTQL
jgi:hypothetical protein